MLCVLVADAICQIWAAANMRARDGCTPLESLDLLVTLLRENDNCEDTLADDYYVAQVNLFTFLGSYVCVYPETSVQAIENNKEFFT